MNGVTTAASIVAGYTAAVALVVYGSVSGCPWVMNACWIAAAACVYAPIARAMRAAERSAR